MLEMIAQDKASADKINIEGAFFALEATGSINRRMGNLYLRNLLPMRMLWFIVSVLDLGEQHEQETVTQNRLHLVDGI